MDSSTINGRTFKLFESGSTIKLSATISYSMSTDTATLDPTNSLRAGVTYRAVVTAGSTDIAGIPLDQDDSKTGLQNKVWTFTARN